MQCLGSHLAYSANRATVLTGYNYFVAVVNLPERFQIVSGDHPVTAGLRLLPMMVSSAAGSTISGILSGKFGLQAPVLVASAAFQMLGYGLMTTLGNASDIPRSNYGYQVFLGLGFGLGGSFEEHTFNLER